MSRLVCGHDGQSRPQHPERAPAPGEVVEELRVGAQVAQRACLLALADGAGGAAHERPAQVVWTDGDSELIVHVARARVRFDDGLVMFGIPVYTDQTGDTEVVVAFAVGSPKAPTGLVMATEPTPRGEAIVVDRWGDALVAAAWDALVHVAVGVAAAAGDDAAGAPLLPAAFGATREAITVLPQARFAEPGLE